MSLNLLWKPRFMGSPLIKGFWPPSNHIGGPLPERDFCPFIPRPAVLPCPGRVSAPDPFSVFPGTLAWGQLGVPSLGRASFRQLRLFRLIVAVSLPSVNDMTAAGILV